MSDWWYVIEEWIGIQSESFILFPVWIYVICIQLIQNYCKIIFNDMEQKEIFEMDGVIRSVDHFQQLQKANVLIHKRLGLSLMTNYCFILITMINASYYSIIYGRSGNIPLFMWDFCHTIEIFLRLLLLCQISDRNRSNVRQINEDYHFSSLISQSVPG